MRAFMQLLLAMAIAMSLAIALIALLFFCRLGDVRGKVTSRVVAKAAHLWHYPHQNCYRRGLRWQRLVNCRHETSFDKVWYNIATI